MLILIPPSGLDMWMTLLRSTIILIISISMIFMNSISIIIIIIFIIIIINIISSLLQTDVKGIV